LKELYIPVDITYETVLDFTKNLKRVDFLKCKDGITIDVRNFAKSSGRIEPFASLLLINSLKHFGKIARKSNIDISIKYIKDEHKIKNTYAKSLRFYSSLGLPIGESPTEDYLGSSASNFIPIMKINASSVKKSVDEYRDIQYIASHISTVASRGNKILYECVNFCVIELLRNIVEHSGSSYIWYCAQYWKSDNSVEISIMDEGIGIQKSLEQEIGNDEKDILRFSLIPGCSSKPTTHLIGDNADNSGFGLYMISELGKENGDFILTSNEESLLLTETNDQLTPCLNQGTIIRLRLNIDDIGTYKVQKERLINKGLKKVKEYHKYRERKKYAPGLPLPKII
jgi:anti-sigma regulatory factor (Ser/Thr protein kinase)